MERAPDTVLDASPEEAEAIRQAVRRAAHVATPYGAYRPASHADAAALYGLLADERVGGPLYTIPQSVTRGWVDGWIASHEDERRRGEGLLLIAHDAAGEATAFIDLQVWPERASAEFGGAVRADLQSASLGRGGAAALFDWLFRDIGVRLLMMTNALDNVRTEKLLRGLGYKRLADRVCLTVEGRERPSMYWELRREDWRSPFQADERSPS